MAKQQTVIEYNSWRMHVNWWHCTGDV